ncbi:MAG: hypothetical protein ACI8ZB_000806 [Desulforhopalus sp.]|jgi:hypothetical protein
MPDSVLLRPAALLIESDDKQRNILKKAIEEHCFFVLVTENGQVGLELWAANIKAVRIPDGLLNKHRRVSEKEYDIIKEHTTIGGNILKEMYQQTGSVSLLLGHDIAIGHHEHWDGSGS